MNEPTEIQKTALFNHHAAALHQKLISARLKRTQKRLATSERIAAAIPKPKR